MSMTKTEKNTSRSDNHLKDHNSIGSNAEFLSRGLYIKCFSYLTPQNNSPSFSFTRESLRTSGNSLTSHIDLFNLFITTIIPEDNGAESTTFLKTVESIIKNAESLNSIGISLSRALHVLFMKNINQKETYDHFYPSNCIQSQAPAQAQEIEESAIHAQAPTQSQFFLSKSDEFKCAFMEYEYSRSSTLKFLVINKQNMTDMEALECFYLNILDSLKSKDTTVHIAQIDNGIIVPSVGLKELLSSCTTKAIGIVPSIETVPTGLLAKIEHYANFQYNIYNLTYYSIACTIPLNHLMYVMKINSSIMENIKMYFKGKINADSSIDYHDFQFSLFLIEQGYQIKFAKNIICQMPRTVITFQQLFMEQTNKMGATFASINIFRKHWSNFSIRGCGNKIALTFMLIGLIFDFLFPSMFSIAIYSIFHEAFNTTNNDSSVFFTGVYILLVILGVSFSLTTRRNGDLSQRVFFSLYVSFVIYYYFVLICSIPAMHYININKSNDSYKFNVAAMIVLIFINFIFGIIPLLMNVKSLISNIVSGLIYLLLGPQGSTSLLLIFSIVNSTDMIGTITWDNLQRMSDARVEQNRKGLLLMLYGLFNGIFLCIIFGLTTRSSRAGGVLALAIIYTIYNICKTFVIIAGLLQSAKTSKIKEDVPLNESDKNEDVGNKRLPHNTMKEHKFPLESGTLEEREPQINSKKNNDDELNDTGCLPATNVQLNKDDDDRDNRKEKDGKENYATFGKEDKKENGNTQLDQFQHKETTKIEDDQVKDKSIELEFDDNDE